MLITLIPGFQVWKNYRRLAVQTPFDPAMMMFLELLHKQMLSGTWRCTTQAGNQDTYNHWKQQIIWNSCRKSNLRIACFVYGTEARQWKPANSLILSSYLLCHPWECFQQNHCIGNVPTKQGLKTKLKDLLCYFSCQGKHYSLSKDFNGKGEIQAS